MQNGHANGSSPPPVSVDPRQAAAFAMQFIVEVAHTRAQRDAYDIAVAFLTAVANGQLNVTSPRPVTAAELPQATEQ